ncbi:MAG: phosphoribosylanthranilate isomerase [Candidatus Thermoplasmatota archaeon]|jgi:phosphoribosylanthranilate isomerase|nr:phosphoribosylanthranilate isomerase [Candidatus Thermoplasmatota archaeon]MCL5793745.1 phosphoribosylanthranilate isomerase [Candidatus Thermoplasmatota archaeon]
MTFRPLVKVCGIKLYEDAEMLMRYDPDMLGVVLDPSIPRAGDETLLRKMDGLGVERVGVYTSIEQVRSSPLYEDIVQLHFDHGRDEIELVHETGHKVMSVVRYTTPSEIIGKFEELRTYGSEFVLLEKKDGIVSAGNALSTLLMETDMGISGKISSDNIQYLLQFLPAMVDLSSSLEKYPGKKDLLKVQDFFRRMSS